MSWGKGGGHGRRRRKSPYLWMQRSSTPSGPSHFLGSGPKEPMSCRTQGWISRRPYVPPSPPGPKSTLSSPKLAPYMPHYCASINQISPLMCLVRTSGNSPLCSTGHRLFGAAALLSLHFFSWSLQAVHRVPLSMCNPWMTSFLLCFFDST